MAHLNRMPEPMRSHLAKLPCPSFEGQPWVPGGSLSHRRVALISTAGLQRRGDRPFEGMMIRPPRALWIPFELGRPLGAPENMDQA